MHPLDRRQFGAALAVLLLPFAVPPAHALSESDAAAGIRAALERGAGVAVDLLGRPDGFLANPRVRIPLPAALKNAARLLRAFGQQQRVDALETAMNRAAEAAVPQARELLVGAIRSMSVEDARRILGGGDDAATQFFAAKTRAPLTERFLPIVRQATAQVDLAEKYNAVAGRAARFGLIRSEDADIEHHVTGRALDGLYLVIGDEERRIRSDPVAAGSALLKKVFSTIH